MTTEGRRSGAAAVNVVYHGMCSTRPTNTPRMPSETIFSTTCAAATAAMPWSAAIQMAGKSTAICRTPVAVNSHDRPVALNTTPGSVASDASAAHTATKASGAADGRHSGP